MSDTVAQAFLRVIDNRPKPKIEIIIDGCTGFLFLDKDGRPKVAMHLENYMRCMRRRYAGSEPASTLKVTPHALRHTFCTNMQQAGIDVKSLQYIMGHSNVRVILDVYTHTDLESVSQAFDVDDACFYAHMLNIKGSKTNGVCAIRDSIRPLLEKARDANVIVFGSPVYYGYPTGQLRSFVERLLFPLDTYLVDDHGERPQFEHKPIQTGLIYTMNCPEWLMEQVQYPTLLGFTGEELGRLCGYNEVMYSCDTYQFSNYERYDCNMFPEEKKREQREKQFPVDLRKAYDLGRRLAERSAAV